MARRRLSHELLDDPNALADAYSSGVSIAGLADLVGVSAATVRRALVRHGIARLPRDRNRRPVGAEALSDRRWLADQYRNRTAVEIARELGVSPTTVYSAMDRHGIARRSTSASLMLRRPELVDVEWLSAAVQRRSSTEVAAELSVSAGSVTSAYRRAGIDPTSTPRLYARGRRRPRPSPEALSSAWTVEGTYRGVGRRLGLAHTTATVWLAEIGVFADAERVLSRASLTKAINSGWSVARIAAEHGVAATTVRVELYRHGLFDSHRNRHRNSRWL